MKQCSECGLEFAGREDVCPRCSFRLAMQAQPEQAQPETAAPAAEIAAPEPPARRRFPLGSLAFLIPVLAIGLLYHVHLQAAQASPQTKIRVLFANAIGPCRADDQVPCMETIQQIRGLNDYADGSLLLGDMNIAKYLHTLPNGAAMNQRWYQDQISEPELMALGDAANQQNLPVCRSFWIYAQIKRRHLSVPQLIIGGAKAESEREQSL